MTFLDHLTLVLKDRLDPLLQSVLCHQVYQSMHVAKGIPWGTCTGSQRMVVTVESE